jgi:hypothetical protein
MQHLKTTKLEALVDIGVKKLSTIALDLMRLSHHYAYNNPKSMPEYITFCQEFIIKLISVQSEEHKELGLEMLNTVFSLVHATCPVKSAYYVKEAGLIECDGLYSISASNQDQYGFLIPSVCVRYVKKVKATRQTFVLFLDANTTLDLKRTWCLSEEFSDEYGGPEYMDFYTNVPERIQHSPPLSGWSVAGEPARAPGPTLEPVESTIPIREEHTTLMKNVANWFIESNLLQLVLGMNAKFLSHSFFTKTIDSLMNGKDFMSGEVVNRFGDFISSSRTKLSEDDCSTIKLAAIAAAKQGVARAKLWRDDMQKHQTALDSVNEALDFLASLERATQREVKARDSKLSDKDAQDKYNEIFASSAALVKEDAVESSDEAHNQCQQRPFTPWTKTTHFERCFNESWTCPFSKDEPQPSKILILLVIHYQSDLEQEWEFRTALNY